MVSESDALDAFVKNANTIQKMMQDAHEELIATKVTGTAGVDTVKVVMNGKHLVTNVEIDPKIFSESSKEVVESLIAAATNDATNKIEEKTKSRIMHAGDIFGKPPNREKK